MTFKFLPLLVSVVVFMESPFAKGSEGMNMVKEVQARTEALKDYQRQRRQVLDHLYQIQQNIKTITKSQSEISVKSQRMRVELEKSQESMADLKEELGHLRQRLGRTALILSQVDASRMMRVLFASKSPADLDRSIKFFGLLIQKEMTVLSAYQQRVREIQLKSEEIQEVLADIQRSEGEMIAAEKSLKSEHVGKLKLISDLDRRRKREIESLRKLRLSSLGKIANELDNDEQIKKYLRPSFIEQQGRLSSPLEGEVLGSYGLTRDPELQTELSLGGWFIAKGDSAEARAPFDGQVAMVHRDDKVQYVVILEHGHDYYTSYSGLKTLGVRQGDLVEAGQVLGTVGYSKRWNADGLHFEIRHFSEAQDPARWIRVTKTFPKQAALED